MATASLLAVGSELLLPHREESNTLWLTAELFRLGIPVRLRMIAGDDLDDTRAAVLSSLAATDLLIITGGLGPTEDDRVREAVAAALDRDLLRDPELEKRVRRIQRRIGTVAENALRQADLPEGARALRNGIGTAPGLWVETDEKLVVCMPGVPREMKRMWEHEVRDRLSRNFPSEKAIFRILRTTGLAESKVGAMLPEHLPQGVHRTILARPGSVDVHHYAWAGEAAEEDVAAAHDSARRALDGSVFAEREESLEEVVARLLRDREETLALAESCTGGLTAHRLTEVPGASKFLLAGWVVYSNQAKQRDLGVPEALLREHGAVSEMVALQLAQGAADRAEADWGIGITGIAGPAGGTGEKPVGTVWIAVARRGGESAARRWVFPGERSDVKLRSSQAAVDMLRRRLLGGAG